MNKRHIDVFETLFEKGKKYGKIKTSEIFELIDSNSKLWNYLTDFYERCSEAGIEVIEDYDSEITKLPSSKTNAIPDNNYLSTVTAYLDDIGRYPLLTAEEEQNLGKLSKYGSPEEAKKARKRLVECNLRLAFSIAKKYSYYMAEPLLDLVQNGNLGLMRASEKFDYERGYRFSTYATPWIHQAILRSNSDNSKNIRIPVHMNNFINRVKRAKTKLETMNGVQPTETEIAQFLNVSVESVKDALLNSYDCVSLYSPIGDTEQDGQLIDIIQDNQERPFSESILDEITVSEIIADAKNYLTEKELDILLRRFGFEDGEEKTLEEVGKVHHLTRERIRQIESKVIEQIQKHLAFHSHLEK